MSRWSIDAGRKCTAKCAPRKNIMLVDSLSDLFCVLLCHQQPHISHVNVSFVTICARLLTVLTVPHINEWQGTIFM